MIDPLEVDLTPLAKLLEGPGLCILHAGVQDLEVLELASGSVPARLFDTQVAGGFLGVPNGSLKSLLDRFLQINLPKGDRLTDWLRRPLTDDQLRYAAADVDHLLDLTDVLWAELDKSGRMDWAMHESALVLAKPRTRRTPEAAIGRIKEARSLKGQAYQIAASLATWREERAAELDTPVRQVLPDLAVVAISQQGPRTLEQMLALRGVEKRHVRGEVVDQILAAIERGKNSDPQRLVKQRAPELPRHLRPVVTLVMAWVSQLARDNKLDPALLATRADVEGLLKSDPSGRLCEGWRSEMVGNPIAQLVAGDAAVAFDGDGKLVLEARSRQSLPTSRGQI